MKKKRRKKKIIHIVQSSLKVMLVLLLVVSALILIKKYNELSLSAVNIVIDAGHGGTDPGANKENVMEKGITLQIANITRDKLEAAGYVVGLVREDDTFIELKDRATYANRRDAKVFVSIHCNSAERDSGNGIETYYTGLKTGSSKPLAEQICLLF